MKSQALILGAEPRVAVTIARSLHRHGIPVTVAGLSSGELRLTSRAIGAFISLPSYWDAPAQCIETLMALICRQRFDMLIPSSDTALTLVSLHYERLKTLLHVACPPPRIVKRVLDKDLTLETAQRAGIPTPATYVVSDSAELEKLLGNFRFPMIAKPRSKTAIGRGTFKIRYFPTLQNLRAAFSTDDQFGVRNLLQEYCVGEGVGIGTFVHNGKALAVFQHRRLKEFPSTGGVSVLAISEAPDPLLVEYALRLLRALEWEGVAMVEFRHNQADRSAVLMEVNGRYWGMLQLAVRAGINFPLYEWQLVHGEEPKVPSNYAVGLRMRWLTGDLLRLQKLFTDGTSDGFPRPSRTEGLIRFFAEFRPKNHLVLWSVEDPLPELFELTRAAKSLVLGEVKRIIKKVIPKNLLGLLWTSRALGPRVGSLYAKLKCLRALGLRCGQDRKIPAEARSILFVCHGNIIRSPMAAAMLRRRLQELGGFDISVASAGVNAKPGKGADPRALAVAREFGISLNAHRTQPLTHELVENSDLIFVMDYLNEARLLARFPEAKPKAFLLGGCAIGGMLGKVEIADPYNGDSVEIRQCYKILESYSRVLASSLLRYEHLSPKLRAKLAPRTE